MKAKLIYIAITALALFSLIGCSALGGSKRDSGLEGSGVNESDLNMARESRFGDGSIPSAEGEEGPFRNVHFDYDSSNLNDLARQNIEFNIQILEQNPQVRVQLEGHCDERGTAEYNLALGQKRAQAVYEVLVSYGVDSNRLSTISYGEEVPIETASNDAAWAKNRRVHFSGFVKNQS